MKLDLVEVVVALVVVIASSSSSSNSTVVKLVTPLPGTGLPSWRLGGGQESQGGAGERERRQGGLDLGHIERPVTVFERAL